METMSTKFRAIKILEDYSPTDFAKFVSQCGFPECKEYIVQNEITYLKFKATHEFQFNNWKKSIDFFDFSNFRKFHRKLLTTPEDFGSQLKISVKDIIQLKPTPQINIAPVAIKTFSTFTPLNKPLVATKPSASIKPSVAQRPNNLKQKIINDLSHSENISNSILPINSTRSQQLEKVHNSESKNLPIPPKQLNISAVPVLPDYFTYSNSENSKSNVSDVCDNHVEDEVEECEKKGKLPDDDTSDGEITYCEVNDVQGEHHTARPFPVVQLPTPPKIDRQTMLKPAILRRAPPQPVQQHANAPNKQRIMIVAQNSIGDDDNDDNDVHVYQELPQTSKKSQSKENTYSMDLTSMVRHISRLTDLDDDEDYLEPRIQIPLNQHTEQCRPLPPTPAQEYSLDHLKNETYFRDINRKSAEKILQTEPIGAFLVRPSNKFFCSFTIKAPSRILNIGTIKLNGNKFHLEGNNPEELIPFHSITDMINYYIENGITVVDGDRVTHVNLLNILKPI